MGKTTIWFCDLCNIKMENSSGGNLKFEDWMGSFKMSQFCWDNICHSCGEKITIALKNIEKELEKQKKPICWWCNGIGCSYCEHSGFVSIEQWEKNFGKKYFED